MEKKNDLLPWEDPCGEPEVDDLDVGGAPVHANNVLRLKLSYSYSKIDAASQER